MKMYTTDSSTNICKFVPFGVANDFGSERRLLADKVVSRVPHPSAPHTHPRPPNYCIARSSDIQLSRHSEQIVKVRRKVILITSSSF
jgi:hypothetical protein